MRFNNFINKQEIKEDTVQVPVVENNNDHRSALRQAVEEASLATMRDFFAGDENAKDPTDTSKMRSWFDQHDKQNVKKKEFRSVADYERWLKQNKLKSLTKEEELDEAPMNPGEFAKAISTGQDKGVLVGFEFEVCIPAETVNMGGSEKDAEDTGMTPKKIADALDEHSPFSSDNLDFDNLQPVSFDAVFKLKDTSKGYKNMQEAFKAYMNSGILDSVLEVYYKIPEEDRKKFLKKYKQEHGPMPTNKSIETQLTFANRLGRLMYFNSRGGSRLEMLGNELRMVSRIGWPQLFRFALGLTPAQVERNFNNLFTYTDPESAWELLRLDDYDEEDDDYWDSYDEDENYSKASKVIATAVQAAMGAKVNIFNDYHEEDKNLTDWYVEPDGSLSPNDEETESSAEIVSPPLPAATAIDALKKFYTIAQELKLYTNNSTGLHINVSIPQKLDVLKLAVFLGDQYVLRYFGRENNRYADSVTKNLSTAVATSDDNAIQTKVGKKQSTVFDKPRQTNTVDEKMLQGIVASYSRQHTASISYNGKYISFRHAGGNYLADFSGIYNTAGRFIRAMIIASDPNLYANEYKTKLVKLAGDKPEITSDTTASTAANFIRTKGLPVLKFYIWNVSRSKTVEDIVKQQFGKQYTVSNIETNSNLAKTKLVAKFRNEDRKKKAQDTAVDKFYTVTLVPQIKSIARLISVDISAGVNTVESNSYTTWAYYALDREMLPANNPQAQAILKQVLRTQFPKTAKKESVSALGQAVDAVDEGMRSVREGEPGIKRVTRKRIDDSTEVRYHVIDSSGVTRKVFDDLANAKAWLSANRPDLHRD